MTTATGRVVHKRARWLEGRDGFRWGLPLCWDADARQRTGESDDELWWISVDHGAIDPSEVFLAEVAAGVDCPDCIEWIRS